MKKGIIGIIIIVIIICAGGYLFYRHNVEATQQNDKIAQEQKVKSEQEQKAKLAQEQKVEEQQKEGKTKEQEQKTLNEPNQEQEQNKSKGNDKQNNNTSNKAQNKEPNQQGNSKKDTQSKYLNEMANLKIPGPPPGGHFGLATQYELGYKTWDGELNKIWGTLRNMLPQQEMENLTQSEKQWIGEKGQYQDAYNKGSAEAAEKLYKMTKERCYYLVNNYM